MKRLFWLNAITYLLIWCSGMLVGDVIGHDDAKRWKEAYGLAHDGLDRCIATGDGLVKHGRDCAHTVYMLYDSGDASMRALDARLGAPMPFEFRGDWMWVPPLKRWMWVK